MRKRKMSNARIIAQSTSSATITKQTGVNQCEWSSICPCLGKCRVSGIFTRFGTNTCACRDYFKPSLLEGFLNNDKSKQNKKTMSDM